MVVETTNRLCIPGYVVRFEPEVAGGLIYIRATALRVVDEWMLVHTEISPGYCLTEICDNPEQLATRPASRLEEVASASGVTRATAVRDLRRKLEGVVA